MGMGLCSAALRAAGSSAKKPVIPGVPVLRVPIVKKSPKPVIIPQAGLTATNISMHFHLIIS